MLYKYKYIALGVGASFIGLLISYLTNSAMWIMASNFPFWLLAGVINAIYFAVKNEENIISSEANYPSINHTV